MTLYTVKAYQRKDGVDSLSEWATGFKHFQASSYFKSLRDSNEFWKVEMFVAPRPPVEGEGNPLV